MRPPDGVIDATQHAPSPIFVRGIMQRSGTNYVQDLLALHPDVAAQTSVYEDHLFADCDLLVRYAELATRAWRGPAAEGGSASEDLLRSLGAALARHLATGIETPWFVTKMPSMDGVQHAAGLFPGAPIVAVVRDGRAVVESAVATFDVPFDREVARWADGARAIVELVRSGSPELIVVKYEDLVSNVQDALIPVLDHIGLDVGRYPFASAVALPVRGSSELANRGGMHWSPVERDSITPERRGTDLSPEHQAVFDRLAGAELEALGYRRDLPNAESSLSGRRLPSRERLIWTSRRAVGRLRRTLRQHV